MDPNLLARLLVGGLADPTATGSTAEQVAGTLDKLPDSDLKAQLQALVRSAESSVDALVKVVSDWADRSLTVLGEGYKHHLRKVSFVIGLIVAIAFNLDTVALTAHLYRDREARGAAVALAMQIAERTDQDAFDQCLTLTPQEGKKDTSCAQLSGLMDAVQSRNASLGNLPIGWPPPEIEKPGTTSIRAA